MTATLSPEKVYANLEALEEADCLQGSSCRQQAHEVLADSEVSQSWKEAICDRLNEGNQLLSLRAVDPDESY
ncbi:MAG: hypothetical protein AAGA60_31935 [Cyanobacteria bacterium P01_E01_bin.42]